MCKCMCTSVYVTGTIRVLDSNLWALGAKPLDGSEVNSAFHHSEVNQMGTRNSWGLSGKNENVSL